MPTPPTAGRPAGAALQYVDRPEISEAFADSIQSFTFDGAVLRIEFTVSRYEAPKLGGDPTGTRTTSCRLVLPPSGIGDLMNKMENLKAALIAAGALTPGGAPTKPPKPTHH